MTATVAAGWCATMGSDGSFFGRVGDRVGDGCRSRLSGCCRGASSCAWRLALGDLSLFRSVGLELLYAPIVKVRIRQNDVVQSSQHVQKGTEAYLLFGGLDALVPGL